MPHHVTSAHLMIALGCAASVVLLQFALNLAQQHFARRQGKIRDADQPLGVILQRLKLPSVDDASLQSALRGAQVENGRMVADYNRVLRRVESEIHSREQAIVALREAEGKYRRIFENAVEGIFQTTPDGRYLAANPALARLYGYDSPEQLIQEMNDIGRRLYVDPECRRRFIAQIAEHGIVRGFEAQVYARDGGVVWISENARAVYDECGKLSHYEGMVEDITQRKEVEDLQRRATHALAASEAKSEFLAKMSHEIRTPLNGVIGMLELLTATNLDTRQTRYARVGRSSAEALLSVVNDILDFSKIEAGKIELANLDFNLVSLIEDVAEMFADRAGAKGLELVCSVAPDVPSSVRGDPDRLRQVLVNLMNNAVKFTQQGEIVLQANMATLRDGREAVRFTVRDTGIGIPPDRMHRLFNAFTQVDASTTRTYGGTGLGLAICRDLMSLMGGEVGVESRVGEGSTFWCLVPFEASPAHAERRTMPAELAELRILAVDDNPTNLEVLREQCQAWGLDVECIQYPFEALGRLDVADRSKRPYGMIVLDHNMPGMDGCTLAREIRRRESYRQTPLLMLSSSAVPEDVHEDDDAPISLCLTKPVRQSRLFDALVMLAAGGRTETAEPAAPAFFVPRLVTKAGQPPRVLVVEDNEINQMVVREILNRSGCRCDVAADGDAAFNRLLAGGYDVVLMDCQIPIRDGFDTTRAWRAHEQEQGLVRQPIIALTANAVEGDRKRCLDAGMDDYLTKPVDPMALSRAIEIALETSPIEPAPRSVVAATAPSAPADPVGLNPIDWQALIARCLGNEVLARATIERFVSRAPEVVNQAREAVAMNDRNQLRPLLHHLKGMASNVSATEIAQAAALLESGALTDTREDLAAGIDAIAVQLERVGQSAGRSVNELTPFPASR